MLAFELHQCSHRFATRLICFRMAVFAECLKVFRQLAAAETLIRFVMHFEARCFASAIFAVPARLRCRESTLRIVFSVYQKQGISAKPTYRD